MPLERITTQLKKLFGKHKEMFEQFRYIFLSIKSMFRQVMAIGKILRLVFGKVNATQEDVLM